MRPCCKHALCGAFVGILFCATTLAGGGAENALLIIDPRRPDAQYIGNYYRNARNIPDTNILYMNPGATDYAAFADQNLDALFGKLANARISDHIDYVIVVAPESYYIPASGLVNDSCSPVNRFAISSAYTLAFVADEVLTTGDLSVMTANRYYRGGPGVHYFDSELTYRLGLPEVSDAARRYFIGATLGYTGTRGNTVEELLDMIDRSVSADGTLPPGTIYYMQTTDPARSGPRHGAYPAAVTNIQTYYENGDAQHLQAVLPGANDCMGIMTGAASPGIAGASMTILPGAFCDHLTSYAAHFDTGSQEKVSLWIAKGASGSWGAIEEPCNYAGKFPHARVHVFYVRGLSLGEAALRSAMYAPFQMMLYGDPLTRPFAALPRVNVNAPEGVVSGVIAIAASKAPDSPAPIASYELLIDGVRRAEQTSGNFTVSTSALSDGWHDVRVLAYDGTEVRSMGRWTGSLVTNNRGGSTQLTPILTFGNHATPFGFLVSSTAANVVETRLVQNGRVVAATPGPSGMMTVHGLTFGAGPVQVQAEALTTSGETVRSAPLTLDIDFSDGPAVKTAPVAFSYTKRVRANSPVLVELPATFDNPETALTYEVLTNPTQATIPAGQSGAYRLIRPNPGASGSDIFTFRVTGAPTPSNTATVTLVYETACTGDVNDDNAVDLADLSIVLANFGTIDGATLADGDLDDDGDVDLTDLAILLTSFGTTCL